MSGKEKSGLMEARDVVAYNRSAWNRIVEGGESDWTKPVSHEEILRARQQTVPDLYLTPTRTIPENWYPPLRGCRVLCLASGGGQQGPLLAAAGAYVTVFDNSDGQLTADRLVAAGFVLTGLFEDTCRENDKELIDEYFPAFIATRAVNEKRKERERKRKKGDPVR